MTVLDAHPTGRTSPAPTPLEPFPPEGHYRLGPGGKLQARAVSPCLLAEFTPWTWAWILFSISLALAVALA